MTGIRATRSTGTARAMARPRGRDRYRPVWLVLAAMMLTGMMAASIQISNVMTSMREEIQTLERTCASLEAQQATLSMRWNSASSRQVIMRRAGEELGLICPDAPGTILVASRSQESSAEQWSRVVDLVSTVDQTPTAMAAVGRP